MVFAANTGQVISTLLSAGTSMGEGGVGSRSDKQNAQRQTMFHWLMPVFVLRRINCSLPWADRRICLIFMRFFLFLWVM